jgi:regulator of protease activity HflC (stomatin/prohibitin superfamily)
MNNDNSIESLAHNPKVLSLLKTGAALLAVVVLLSDSFYSVNPTDRANVRRFGVVQFVTPVQPGLHFKIPFVDVVDHVQVSLTTLHIPPFDVTTVDNQKVTLDLNFNYTIPDDRVNHVMYEIGRSGNSDIESQIIPVARDRASRVFASQNMVSVNSSRVDIQNEIEASISKSVEELFGIQPHSLQIASIRPSDAFMASNEAAVRAKNEAVAAENTKRTKQFEADQRVIQAKGDADSAIEAARGRAEAVRLEAEANKIKLVLEGSGQESRIDAEIKPFGSPERYVQYLQAKAALQWNGQMPQVMSGSGSGSTLVVPIPGGMMSGKPQQ